MAICNLFRSLSKKTGNVMMFSQYSEDLTQCFTQHDNYDVIPSRFVVLNIDYSKLNGTNLGAKDLTGDLNVDFPTYLQNYFENGCAWLRGNQIEESWNPESWSADVHTNLFWNFMIETGLMNITQVSVEDEHGETTTIDTFKEVKYVGDIDIHSYETRDGVGYNEIYCYIPNSAEESYYQINLADPNKDIADWTHLPNHKEIIEGRTSDDTHILGALDMTLSGNTNYYYTQNFGSIFTEPLEESSDENAVVNYNAYRVLDELENPTDMFKFNTVVVLYDIMVRDADANIITAYKNVPLAIFLTGLINQDGTVTNEVQKYSNNDDAYGSGTSYGLRICTRFMVTPNATTILTTEADIADQYAGFSRAMDKMAESQDLMNTVLADVVNRSQDLKDHLAMFKNYRVNVPYVIYITEDGEKVPYWFVNGKNTGERVNQPGVAGRDGATPEVVEVDGKYFWFINGESTGVLAEGIPGADGFDGQYWFHGTELTHEGADQRPAGQRPIFIHDGIPQKVGDFYINTDTGYVYVLNLYQTQTQPQWNREFCIKGVRGNDGTTPDARPNPNDNGILWWYVGNTAICRAQAIDGKDILCLTGIYSDADKIGFSTSDCKPGDVIVYVGGENDRVKKYDLYTVTDTKFTVTGTQYYQATLNGNIKGRSITNVYTTETKKTIVTVFNLSDGSTITIKNKREYITPPRFSSLQRSYACWDDVVYYRPGDKMWVEIPYNYEVTSSMGGMTTFKILPSIIIGDGISYAYIVKNTNGNDNISTNGYRFWNSSQSDLTFTVSNVIFARMQNVYGRFCRLGKLHLYAQYTNNSPGLLHAVYDYAHKDQLVWKLIPQDRPVTVQRHGLTFVTPYSWSTNGDGNLAYNKKSQGADSTWSNFDSFHQAVITGKHAVAFNLLWRFGTQSNQRLPLYSIDDTHHVYAKIWVKLPRNSRNSHTAHTDRGDFYFPGTAGGWAWKCDRRVTRNKTDYRKNGHVRYRLNWTDVQKLINVFKKNAFGGSKKIDGVSVRNKVPYLYFAIFDKVGSMGYMYKLTLGSNADVRVRNNISPSWAKIIYQGRIPYFKKTR